MLSKVVISISVNRVVLNEVVVSSMFVTSVGFSEEFMSIMSVTKVVVK